MGNISLVMEKKHITRQYRTYFKDNRSFVLKRAVVSHRRNNPKHEKCCWIVL